MSEQFIGEVRLFSFNFAPKGWAMCNGQLLPINQNQALFSLLGTYYGGDGRTTFALPDLRGRIPLHMSAAFPLGQRGGEENHILALNEMPQHVHLAYGSTGDANAGSPVNNTWGAQSASPFSSTANSMMNNTAIGPCGTSQPHPNLSPYLALNICIALVGIFPPRS